MNRPYPTDERSTVFRHPTTLLFICGDAADPLSQTINQPQTAVVSRRRSWMAGQ
jgi:hypothetical protein